MSGSGNDEYDDLRTGGAGDLLGDLSPLDDRYSAGDRIGPYRIEGPLGEGGMASVYRARRVEGTFDQTVAIKVLGYLHGNEDLLRRFRQERQILAAMAHPNIATLLDGGFTERGHPYLVMELVEGLSISDYCSDNRISLNKRLRLFIQVLKAVEYAHARMVVHRDIKPQNILVNSDGTPMLLDFGIAKILATSDIEYTGEKTQTGIRVLTFEYAAPEQLLGGVITTATDIYQLGVLLYLLITGRRPFDTRGMNAREAERLICETSPVPPSMAASVNVGPSGLPAQLDIKPGVLRRIIAGDLDTIVMTCLRHEPHRRYASVSDLIADLEAYLAGHPISARRDSLLYRAGRFIDRHRGAVAVAATATVALLAVTVLYLVDLTHARDRAERQARNAQEMSSFLTELIGGTNPYAPEGAETDVRRLIDRAYDDLDRRVPSDPALRAQILTVIAGLYNSLANFDRAIELANDALESAVASQDPELEAEARFQLAGILWRTEALNEAADHVQRLLDDRAVGRCCAELKFSHDLLALHGRILRDKLDHDGAEAAFLEAAILVDEAGRGVDPDFQDARFGLAILKLNQDKPDEAEPLLASVVQVLEQAYGPDHLELTSPLDSLANARSRLGRLDEAQATLQRVLEIRRLHLGSDNPWVANSYQNLSALANHRGDHAAMAQYAARAREIREAHFGRVSTQVVHSMINEAIALSMLGRFAETMALDREMLDIIGQLDPPMPHLEIHARTNMGAVALSMGHDQEALAELERATALALEIYGADNVRYARARSNLAGILLEMERYQEAREHLSFTHEAYLNTYGADSIRLAYAQIPLARAEAALGNIAQAHALLDRAWRLREAEFEPDHPMMAEIVQARAFVEYSDSNYVEAMRLADQALTVTAPETSAQDVSPVRLMMLAIDAAVADGRCDYANAKLQQVNQRFATLDSPSDSITNSLTRRSAAVKTCGGTATGS